MGWLPYCTSEFRLDYCKELAAELRQSGEYDAVRVDRKGRKRDGAGQMTEFGKVFCQAR